MRRPPIVLNGVPRGFAPLTPAEEAMLEVHEQLFWRDEVRVPTNNTMSTHCDFCDARVMPGSTYRTGIMREDEGSTMRRMVAACMNPCGRK